MKLPQKSVRISPLQLYLVGSLIAAPLFFVLQMILLRQGKESPKRRRERFGKTDLPRPAGRLVWFNASSIGESLALLDLIRAVLAAGDDIHVLVTTHSLTSAQLLGDLLPDRAMHQFTPFDTRGAVNRFLTHWRPDVSVWTESDLWPRVLLATASREIPMLWVNARMSQTLARWRFWQSLVRDLLKPFDRIFVSEQTLSATLQELGVAREKLAVVGSLKEDCAPLDVAPDELNRLSLQLNGRAVWLAASTHEGEEDLLVDAHQLAFGRRGNAPLLVIAPRHPHRGPAIMQKLQAKGWQVALRSQKADLTAQTEIYVADTLGEMGLWYRVSPVTFVGGSLVPLGGHNPYEPVKLDCAVIHGGDTSNFADIYQRLDQCGGALLATSSDAVAQALVRLQHQAVRASVTQAARTALKTNASATSAALTAICALLPFAGARHVLKRPDMDQISVIAPNFKRRLSGVTSTVLRLVPRQALKISVAAVGPLLPKDVPQVSILSLLTMSRSGPEGWRVWHARRNIEMLAGLGLRHVLGKRMKLVFTLATDRHPTRFTHYLLRRMDALVAVSEKSASCFSHPAQIIGHGIDTMKFFPTDDKAAQRTALGIPSDGQLMGCFGRIRPAKGTDLFVEAAIDLCKRHKDLRAILLGRATRRDKKFLMALKEQVRAAGLTDRILFKDEVPVWATPDWYRALDVYVTPSLNEGFGVTPLEAMACAVPVVATDVGAFRSMIVEGKTGFVVAPGSSQPIIDALRALLIDPNKCAALGLAARAHVVAHFDIEQEADALIHLYRQLLSQ